VLVQARPIVHPVVKPRASAPPALLAALVADGRVWTWDVAHNPDPLSVAQAGLVERVDRAAIAPYALRVCAGYLYSAPRGEVPPIAAAVTRTELAERAAEIETRLAEALGMEVPPLDEAIARYLAFYRIWAGELGPLIAATRAGLTPAQLAGARPSAVEATLLAAARGEQEEANVVLQLGVLAPAWDVAVPTYGERPGVLRDAIARARSIERDSRTLAQPIGSSASERDLVARDAADLAERDDHWFARAQLLVRKSAIARARELGIDPDDAFWIPLEDLEQNHLDPDDVRRRASAARNAAERARQWSMPRTVGGPVQPPAIALRGIGTGSRVTGRIVRLATLASTVAIGSGDIVVARAVTPALAVAVIGCAALVSETGGLLDHGAALARELGIPCVVGCHDAWSLLSDGMVVTVDGDAGSVEIAS
jgi:pyruvate,water dikinase